MSSTLSVASPDISAETRQAAALLIREVYCLDRRLWDEWLALYTEDAIFWMPAWKSETEQTRDPDRELSLIYYQGRERLEERVWRVRSGRSPASVPMPRTMHVIANVQAVEGAPEGALRLHSNWTVHHYDVKRKEAHVLFGFYEHELRRDGDGWLIARKHITLLNDRIPAAIDFYSV